MSMMAEKALTQQKKTQDLMATELSGPGLNAYQCLHGMTVPEPSPLFSRHILTVEQLSQIQVDPDIQAAVSDFLKGLTTQMFARIVRNGSSEVGSWLGAKIQGERDGWTTRLRMAMDEIEHQRKNALQGQVLLQETLQQLKMLVECFQVSDETKADISEDDAPQGIQKCVEIILECCNVLMEDRFECCEVLEKTDPPPDRLSTVVKVLKDGMADLEEQKATLEKQCGDCTQENTDLKQRNEHLLEQVKRVQEQMKNRHTELETLKSQLKELDKVVKIRKNTTAEKCVGTTLDLFQPPGKHKDMTGHRDKAPSKQTQGVNTTFPSRENMFTQTLREPSFIEISEEKLKVLKERARKLESSIHDAISNMDRLKKGTPEEASSSCSPSSQRQSVVASIPSGNQSRAHVKTWLSTSFEVTNAPSRYPSLGAMVMTADQAVITTVPKLGHFKGTERRCFSERPLRKVSDEPESKTTKQDSRKLPKPRVGQVSKCLRCLKLFTSTDNHKLACCFHTKGKERMEVYSAGGQLLRVHYAWKCCNQQAESDGCCYGHHV